MLRLENASRLGSGTWVPQGADVPGHGYEESQNRKIGADGKLPPVGNSVDLKTATYANDIGATQLARGWTDPEFKPDQRAFYYARVLEIPTPRWNTYDAVRMKM